MAKKQTNKPTAGEKPATTGEKIEMRHLTKTIGCRDIHEFRTREVLSECRDTARRIDAAIRRAVKECRQASPNPHHYNADGWKRIMAKYRVKL
jgi:hypothetical protein